MTDRINKLGDLVEFGICRYPPFPFKIEDCFGDKSVDYLSEQDRSNPNQAGPAKYSPN